MQSNNKITVHKVFMISKIYRTTSMLSVLRRCLGDKKSFLILNVSTRVTFSGLSSKISTKISFDLQSRFLFFGECTRSRVPGPLSDTSQGIPCFSTSASALGAGSQMSASGTDVIISSHTKASWITSKSPPTRPFRHYQSTRGIRPDQKHSSPFHTSIMWPYYGSVNSGSVPRAAV